MHEMSLAESMLQIIQDAARIEKFKRVKTVWLEIGQLACVEKESMRFCFDAAMRGSIAEQARLEVIETAGRGQCVKCSLEIPIAALYEACPSCGSYEIRVTGGDEMRIKELEVE
ncbi:MAG: hydrogenase maturation nickel metallochaperone HypA [Betaproteobacteria bacterium RBG_16_56_24]|nr:MAG: hydrogenase maturation nickel metallochaperone HypA [Betaproteobacteria bacterium RBG_16_56_24]